MGNGGREFDKRPHCASQTVLTGPHTHTHTAAYSPYALYPMEESGPAFTALFN